MNYVRKCLKITTVINFEQDWQDCIKRDRIMRTFEKKGKSSVNKEEIVESLATITILFDEPLMNYTFTKTGGPADVLAFPKNKKK